jgi:hypothetical protein
MLPLFCIIDSEESERGRKWKIMTSGSRAPNVVANFYGMPVNKRGTWANISQTHPADAKRVAIIGAKIKRPNRVNLLK